ncbi:MAG: ABC transporter permease subunit [Nitrospiraceae bacterium]|nr:ABC transporter permease subunit [Nitrospiraceae bacterium]
MNSPYGHSRFVERSLGVAWRLLLVTILFLTFFPFVFMLMTAFKDTHQFYHSFWLPAWPPHLDNFVTAFNDMKFYIFNSLLVTGLSVSGVVVGSTLAGFVFARYDFPGRELLYYGIIAVMMIPGALMLIPSFVWVKQLRLIDTYSVMVLPYIAGGQIMGIYLLRGFFSQIDNALFEASQVDGAGVFRQIWHIALPLAKPILGVVAIISALGVWNQFLWPLVTTSSEDVMVLTVGMLRYNSRVGGQYGLMFAGYTISAIPLGILFVLTTRTFMKGITSGALKA